MRDMEACCACPVKARESCCGCEARSDLNADCKPLLRRRPPNWRRSSTAKSCCQYVGIGVGVLTLAGLVHGLVVRATLDVRCERNEAVDRVFPEPPITLSDTWRGIIWMDQGGSYGHSDLPEGLGSLAMSFGDASVDAEARTARAPPAADGQVRPTGSSWTVANSPSGYLKYFSTAVLRYSYLFEFGEDYMSAQIYPSVQPLGGWLGTWYVPKALMSFRMNVQRPSGMTCPPPLGANKTAIAHCARWDRETTYLRLIPSLSRWLGAVHYPAFEIVDPSGQKQPAFDAYLRWADSTTNPDPVAAWLFLGMNLRDTGCGMVGSSLLGRS